MMMMCQQSDQFFDENKHKIKNEAYNDDDDDDDDDDDNCKNLCSANFFSGIKKQTLQ